MGLYEWIFGKPVREENVRDHESRLGTTDPNKYKSYFDYGQSDESQERERRQREERERRERESSY